MAWPGFYEYGGNEIINVARTEAYARNLQWFRPVYKNDSLPFMLGDGLRYTTPLLDNAPWVDPDIPESLEFYGLYPLDITGMEDSSRGSSVIESLSDGGLPGRIRNATKSIVFSGALIAESEAGAEYGHRWLKRALLGGPCSASASSASGDTLCYLASEPYMELPNADDLGAQALLDGGFFGHGALLPDGEVDGSGPSSETDIVADGGEWDDIDTDETDDTDGGTPAATGGVLMYVPYPVQTDDIVIDGGAVVSLPDGQFEGGTPSTTGTVIFGGTFPFNAPRAERVDIDPEDCLVPYSRSFRKVLVNAGPTVSSKRTTQDGGAVWLVQFTAVVGNPYELGPEVRVIEGFLDPEVESPWVGGVVEGATVDLNGYIHPETSCATVTYEPLYDPLYPALIPPPGPPSVPLGSFKPPVNWRRRQFTIPKQYVPLWGEVVPKIAVHARDADLRNLRLRFYADPYKVGDISDDPCAYCGDIVISYVPRDHTLILDGAEQTVRVQTPGGALRRADSLVFKTDGTPFDWPTLSCGFGYVVTVDLPQTQVPPVVDLSLFARAV